MNLTGYDHETAEAFHPVRERARKAMANVLPEDVLEPFREPAQKTLMHVAGNVWYSLLTDGAPDFRPIDLATVPPVSTQATEIEREQNQIRSLQNSHLHLSEPLRAAWAVPAVQEMFQGIEEESLDHVRPHAQASEKGLEAAFDYLRVADNYRRVRCVVIPNLLLSFWSGIGPRVGATFYEIPGPMSEKPRSPDPEEIGNSHEILHPLLAPVTRDPQRADLMASRTAGIFEKAMEHDAVRGNYGLVSSFVEECLVHAVSFRIENYPSMAPERRGMARATALVSFGMLLAPWFYEKLDDYERGHATFGEWFDATLSETTTERVLDHLTGLGVEVMAG